MDKEFVTARLNLWLTEFVEKPNPRLGDWPPCPYARQARINNRIGTYFLDTETVECLEQTVYKILPTLDQQHEVAVICFDHTILSVDQIHTSVDKLNQDLMTKDYVILEDHPNDVEYVNDVHMNFGECGLFVVQHLSKLNTASEQLKAKGYYDHWSQEELDAVVTWRVR